MIVRLSGRLVAIDTSEPKNPTLLVEPAGAAAIVLAVDAPTYLFALLEPRVGETLTLHTMAYLEGSPTGGNLTPRIVGFENEVDRAFFELFTTVKGIGIRKALRALAQPPGLVASWVENGDAKAIATLPEIGKRLAETVIASLRGKLVSYVAATPARPRVSVGAKDPGTKQRGAVEDEAIRILVSWGDKPADAERSVDLLKDAEPGFATLDAAGIVRAIYRRRSS